MTTEQRKALKELSGALYKVVELAEDDDNFNDELSTIKGYSISLDELAYNFLMASK